MCGFVGWLDPTGVLNEPAARRLIATMRDQLAHRGPDDCGTWLDPERGVAFGFRRLSIIDLSPAGHQPMVSANGRYVLMLNGEIYNFAEIRAEIDAVSGPLAWRGHSDTEVLVEAIAVWGVEQALARANGMFAFTVWDREEQALHLARDRIGKKPLYYGWAGSAFVFGSELKALWPHPEFDAGIDAEALAEFLRLGYVPGARSIFRSVSKLRAGHVLRVPATDVARREAGLPSAYWSLKDAALRGLDAQESGRPASVTEFEALARDAVALRQVADVPVGAFLSGGIDSSLVTALMAASAPGEVRSFSVGFEAVPWDEAPHAAAVAAHLGTRHLATYIGPGNALGVVADLPAIYDEPFADDSMIPTTLLCRMARAHVTVALSGDGGDELFAGYDKYADAAHWLDRRAAMPGMVRSLADAVMAGAVAPLARRWGGRKLARRAHLLGTLLAGDPGGGMAERFNAAIMEQTLDPERLLAEPGSGGGADAAGGLGRGTAIDRLTFMDTGSYLIDDILVKVDRASMAASLEVRCPLLDYRLIELSWRFPTEAKIQGGVGKLPLRAALHRYVPRALVERPKQGFGAPVEAWLSDGLRGGLRPWAEALMSRPALGRSGLLDVAACRSAWEDFTVRGRGWDPVIWRLLMFQAWHEWMADRVASPQAAPARMRLPAAAL